MPAAAVIPAPIAYIKVVAVKKLVVEPLGRPGGPASIVVRVLLDPAPVRLRPLLGGHGPAGRRGRLTSSRRGVVCS